MTTWQAHVEAIRANTHPAVLIAAAAAAKRAAIEAAAKKAAADVAAHRTAATERTAIVRQAANAAANHAKGAALGPKVPVLMNALPPGTRSRSHQVLRSSTMTGHTQPSQLSFEFSRV